jgi:hypothetical protein
MALYEQECAKVKQPLAPLSPPAWQRRTDRRHQQLLPAQMEMYQMLIGKHRSQKAVTDKRRPPSAKTMPSFL